LKFSVTEFVAKIAILSLLVIITVYREVAIPAPREEFLFFVGSAAVWLSAQLVGGVILGLVIWGVTTLLVGRTSRDVGQILVLGGIYLLTLFVLWGEGTRIATLTGKGVFEALVGDDPRAWSIYAVGLAYAIPGVRYQDFVGGAFTKTQIVGTNRWKLFGATFAIYIGVVFLIWLFVRGSEFLFLTLGVGIIVAPLALIGFFLFDLLEGRRALWKLPVIADFLRGFSSSQPAQSDGSDQSSASEPQPASKNRRSYLAILELAHDASAADIKAAYRRLIQQYHPDKVAHLGKELRNLAERKAKEINEAYEALLDTHQH